MLLLYDRPSRAPRIRTAKLGRYHRALVVWFGCWYTGQSPDGLIYITSHFCKCQVVRWIAARGRYGIELDDGGENLAVKPANLIPLLQAGTFNIWPAHVCSASRVRIPPPLLCHISGATALIRNLEAQQYNGLPCDVKKYDQSRQRYLVQLHRGGKQRYLKVENLR